MEKKCCGGNCHKPNKKEDLYLHEYDNGEIEVVSGKDRSDAKIQNSSGHLRIKRYKLVEVAEKGC